MSNNSAISNNNSSEGLPQENNVDNHIISLVEALIETGMFIPPKIKIVSFERFKAILDLILKDNIIEKEFKIIEDSQPKRKLETTTIDKPRKKIVTNNSDTNKKNKTKDTNNETIEIELSATPEPNTNSFRLGANMSDSGIEYTSEVANENIAYDSNNSLLEDIHRFQTKDACLTSSRNFNTNKDSLFDIPSSPETERSEHVASNSSLSEKISKNLYADYEQYLDALANLNESQEKIIPSMELHDNMTDLMNWKPDAQYSFSDDDF